MQRLLGFFFLLLAACGDPSPESAVVHPPTGPLIGSREAGVSAFRAIPYAAPPMGARRFQPPAPAAVWTDPRPATDVGPGCPQQMGEAYLGQEDCLTLDVWTPVTDPEEPLPVMVWLHGGGLVQGGGPDAMNDGRVLARDAEVVVVMVQYRLGALGYLGDPSLRDERGAVGNYGLLDQLAALRWVRENIGAFGGDPARVTLFGSSAGGASVVALASMPAADGLFDGVIVQSAPAAWGLPAPEEAAARAQPLVDAVGCGGNERERAACLRAVPAETLVRASASDDEGLLGPGGASLVVDGVVLAEQPIDGLGDRPQRRWLVGTNREEAGVIRLLPLTALLGSPELYGAAVGELFGEDAAALLEVYPASAFDDPTEALVTLLTERFFTCPNLALQDARPGSAGYRFTHRLRGEPAALGAFHSLEIATLFGTLSPELGGAYAGYAEAPADARAGELLRSVWGRFAHGAMPIAAGAHVDLDEEPVPWTADEPALLRCRALEGLR